jgi:hypothetical protein
MAQNPKKPSQFEIEVERRRDEALKRALGMPHKPHKDKPKQKEKKTADR